MFKPVNAKIDFPALEREILSLWTEQDIMAKYLSRNENSEKRFSFIDGPITANNPMGVHHAWGRSYKDLFQKFKTMQGYKQRYQNGFDGQGLWIEVEVEKELGFKSKRDIEAFGIGKFVELCKQRVLKFSDIITEQSIRLAHWAHWNNSYHTMSDENNYTIWLFLKKCHDEGWLYEGRDVMPWCPRCGTGLSQHEIVTEGYKDIVHPGLYVKFPLIELPDRSRLEENETQVESLLIWTTTPWTLSSNVAAAVNPDKTYARVKENGEILYLMKERLAVLNGDYHVLEEIKGKDLIGLTYRGPFDELPIQQDVEHKIIPSDEVNESEGTGVVHTAPGAGQEDFALGQQFSLPSIAPLDEFGDFVEGFDWLTGMNVYDVNEHIYKSLRQKGIFYKLEEYSHRYPVCWRCDSELVFRLVDEWFISMQRLRHKIANVTRNIRWIPAFGMERELDWLRNMSDWMISKKRYWGLALPIYKCQCGWFDVIGSEKELQERSIQGWNEYVGHSPHRPWIDVVKIRCEKCGEAVSRIKDVGTPWLDAGIVPFSTINYRSDKNEWKEWFPADWISESFPGQFRNWFYSLLTMSTVLEGTEPFRTVFSYALMKDENGEEMHKSKGNAIWFEDAADVMGVDAMRWLYARHNPAANLNFGYGAADEVRRRFIIPLWNVYSFFVTYANIDNYDPSTSGPAIETRSELDRWIISELNNLVDQMTTSLENYEPDRATRIAENFVEYLSNWYVRRSRRRFWKSGVINSDDDVDIDKLSAYSTLFECLITLTKLLAPIMPFVTESMYQNLSMPLSDAPKSVHLTSYPLPNKSLVDEDLSAATRLAMRLSSMGRAARSKAGLKVRQPLQKVIIKLNTASENLLLDHISSQIRDELNVKTIVSITDEFEVLDIQIQPNMSLIGPKYGKKSSNLRSLISDSDPREIYGHITNGQDLKIGPYNLHATELNVIHSEREGFSVVIEGGYIVAVSTVIDHSLALEGKARELVHRVQNMRRSADFNIEDRITLYYETDSDLDEMISSFGKYIMQETLSEVVLKGDAPPGSYVETQDIDDSKITIGLLKA